MDSHWSQESWRWWAEAPSLGAGSASFREVEWTPEELAKIEARKPVGFNTEETNDQG